MCIFHFESCGILIRMTRLFFFSLLIMIMTSMPAKAEWEMYQSKTKLFEMYLPEPPSEELEMMRTSPFGGVYSSEVIADIDQRPYKNAVKRYAGKVSQTFGPALTNKERVNIINKALDNYQRKYEQMDGVVREREVNKWGENGRIFISYEDEELGIQSIIVKVITTETSKFEQVLFVPDSIVEDPSSRDFLAYFDFEKNLAYIPGDMNKEWDKQVSPLQIFSIKTPPLAHPFVTKEPIIKNSDKQEYVSVVFYDPVREENLYYNVYGYRFDGDLTFAKAKTVLAEKHIARYKADPAKVQFNRSFINDKPAYTASFAVPSPKAYPYLNMVELRAIFIGNFMAVQEIMGSNTLVQSSFADEVAALFEFTPDQAMKAYLMDKVDNQMKR